MKNKRINKRNINKFSEHLTILKTIRKLNMISSLNSKMIMKKNAKKKSIKKLK